MHWMATCSSTQSTAKMQVKIKVNYQFVNFIPEDVEEGVLYISMEYATATHKCCCGCQNIVVTPISPTDWCLTYDGESVSLSPSIGNWSFNCRSHYWIRRSEILWAEQWSQERVNSNRAFDLEAKTGFFQDKETARPEQPSEFGEQPILLEKPTYWQRIKTRLTCWFR